MCGCAMDFRHSQKLRLYLLRHACDQIPDACERRGGEAAPGAGARALGPERRRRRAAARRCAPGRSRRSSSRRRGSHHLLRDARAVEEAIDEVAEGVARGAVAPEPAYQRVHRRSGSDGRARPPPAARKRRTSCSSLPFTRGRTAVGAACNPATWHGIREGVGQGQGPRAPSW